MIDIEFITTYYSYFLEGAKITLMISLFGVIFGTFLGIIVCLLKISNIKIFEITSSAYIEIIRGTPLLLQLYIVYYGLPMALPFELSRMTLGTIAVFLNSSAYIAEIIRAGINSIDKGQMEAAKSLGMSNKLSMRYVILPQAFKNVLPALGNEFITLIKESAIVSVVGIHDIMYNADTLRGITYKPFMPLVYAALIYFIMTFTLSKAIGKIEGSMKKSD